jgi:hypothetical protein
LGALDSPPDVVLQFAADTYIFFCLRDSHPQLLEDGNGSCTIEIVLIKASSSYLSTMIWQQLLYTTQNNP